MVTHQSTHFEFPSSCPVCGSNNLQLQYDSVPGVDYEGVFKILICDYCCLGITSPVPSQAQLQNLYIERSSSDFPRTGRILAALRRTSARLFARDAKRLLRTPVKQTTVLDFGCGDGLAALAIAAYLDASIDCVDFHHNIPPLLRGSSKTSYSHYSAFTWTAVSKYDLIICRHVLEHLHSPSEQLRSFEHALKPGGLLIVEVPNFDCVWRSVFGRFWWALYTPRHLTHFSPSSLRNLVGSIEGFRVVKLRGSSTPVIGGSIGLLSRLPISNLSAIGLVLYPIQFIGEVFSSRRSTLVLTLQKAA